MTDLSTDLPARTGWRRYVGRAAATALQIALLLSASAGALAEGSVTLGGPFTLIDQDGQPRSDRDFHGSYLLIFFGFTHCPDTCPTTLTIIGDALDRFAQESPERAARVVPVFVTVDPARDTPAVLKDYIAHFHPRLVGLSGTPEQIDQMTRLYGVYYAPVPTGTAGDYLMDHSAFILLMGPRGDYLTHFDHGDGADEIVDGLSRWLSD